MICLTCNEDLGEPYKNPTRIPGCYVMDFKYFDFSDHVHQLDDEGKMIE